VSYVTGKQPCGSFDPKLEANAYGMWRNVHECVFCGSTVSYCENCHRDHHEGGYENCKRVESGKTK